MGKGADVLLPYKRINLLDDTSGWAAIGCTRGNADMPTDLVVILEQRDELHLTGKLSPRLFTQFRTDI